MRVWSTHRPISIGTYPEEYGVLEIVNFTKPQYVTAIGHTAYGYIDFERDLPKSEQDHYDLRPAPRKNPKLEAAAKSLARAIDNDDADRIDKICDKAIRMGLVEDAEELVEVAVKFCKTCW